MNDKSIRLLLIEDNPGDARLLQEMLREAQDVHFELVWVDRLAKGLDKLQGDEVDAVLADLSLPDASGLDSVVRTRQAAPDVPIIVLTGSADSERGLRAVREGAQDYLIKGFVDPELVVRTIRYAIERKRTEAKLARYTRELRMRNEQMRADLVLAREIQLALLPQQYPTFPPGVTADQSAFTFHHYYQSATYLAGDFFEIFPVSETAAGLFICDVMGHGVRASLVTAMVRPLVDEFSGRGMAPGELLTRINRELCSIFQQAGATIFATAFYAIADARRGTLTYANAGHPPAIHIRRRTSEAVPLHMPVAEGPALGLFADQTFATTETPLDAGDTVLLYTDGLFEVTGRNDEDYGSERVLETVRLHRDLRAAELIPTLLADVQRFAVEKQFADDVCLVGLQVQRRL